RRIGLRGSRRSGQRAHLFSSKTSDHLFYPIRAIGRRAPSLDLDSPALSGWRSTADVDPGGSMSLRARFAYGVLNGLNVYFIKRAMRKGDPTARLIRDRATAADPYPAYDEMRQQGRLVKGGLGYLTAHHDLVESVLKDPRFGHVLPETQAKQNFFTK